MFALLVSAALLVGAAWGQAAPAITWKPVVDVRQRALLDATFDGAAASSVEQRVRLGMEVERLGVAARVSFQDVRAWAVAPGPVQGASFAPSVAEGWVKVKGDLTRKVGAVATVGRQRVVVDEGRIVGDDPYSAEGRLLDAVRIVGRAAPISLEYVNARRFEGSVDAPLGYGVNLLRVGASGENPMTTWVADVLWVADDRATADATTTIGTYLRFDTGRWRGRAEGYLQGTDGGTASLLGLSAGWVFGPNERFVTHLRYDALSGEGDGGAWRPVLGDTHRFNGLLDRYADPASRPDGLSDLRLVVDARPAPQLALGGSVHQFWRNTDGRALGSELDADAAWSFSPFVALRVEAGWFAPTPPTGDGHRVSGYLELDATF